MDKSEQRVVQFLEKEIKTYTALALFLSKEGVQKFLHPRARKNILSPHFYKERMKEARKIVNDLRKQN
jgi:hypothetical protein